MRVRAQPGHPLRGRAAAWQLGGPQPRGWPRPAPISLSSPMTTSSSTATGCVWLLAPFHRPEVGAVTGMVLPLRARRARAEALRAVRRLQQGPGAPRVRPRPRTAPASGCCTRTGVACSGRATAWPSVARLWCAAGGFDPALGAGSVALAGADIEAMSAAILRGERLVYEPRSMCWHEHRDSDEALRRQLFNYGVGFTAILTKALTQRPAVSRPRVARSVPGRGGVAPPATRASDGPAPRCHLNLPSCSGAGMLRGPGLYLKSRPGRDGCGWRACRGPLMRYRLHHRRPGCPESLADLGALLDSIAQRGRAGGDGADVARGPQALTLATPASLRVHVLPAPEVIPLSVARNRALEHARANGAARGGGRGGLPGRRLRAIRPARWHRCASRSEMRGTTSSAAPTGPPARLSIVCAFRIGRRQLVAIVRHARRCLRQRVLPGRQRCARWVTSTSASAWARVTAPPRTPTTRSAPCVSAPTAATCPSCRLHTPTRPTGRPSTTSATSPCWPSTPAAGSRCTRWCYRLVIGAGLACGGAPAGARIRPGPARRGLAILVGPVCGSGPLGAAA